MKIIILRISLLLILILFYIVNISVLSRDYVYTESFEGSKLPVKQWANNAPYTLHFFGPSSERVVDGKRSLKVDITIHGEGDKECYYYWALPVRVNLHGDMNFSAFIWADSQAAKYVSIGFDFLYPPTPLSGVTMANNEIAPLKWQKFSREVSQDVLASASSISSRMIYGATVNDLGRELNRIGIFIRARGEHRLKFFIDMIELKGKVMSASDFNSFVKKKWNAYKNRLNLVVDMKNRAFSSLPSIPDIENSYLSQPAKVYQQQLYADRSRIRDLINAMETQAYFPPSGMDSLESLLAAYPSKVELLKAEIRSPEALATLFPVQATKHYVLNGFNLPPNAKVLEKISIRAAPGEYEPASFLIQPKRKLENLRMKWTDFTSQAGTIKSGALDVKIVKVWYQAGIKSTDTKNKYLVQELLLNDDALIKVDYDSKTNYLRVQDNSSADERYIDVSTPSAVFPQDVKVMDSKTLKPFDLDGKTNKQIWLTIKVPEDAPAGKYTSTFTVESDNGIVGTFPVELEVLPFKLSQSRLTYSIYYHGAIRPWKQRPFHTEDKTEAQLYTDLKDMMEHGVLYPNNYQDIKNLGRNLSVRNRVGLPKDRLYSTQLDWFKNLPQDEASLNALKKRITEFQNEMTKHGYKNLYIYGIDEAKGEKLKNQRQGWTAARSIGARIFVAGYKETYETMGDLLDLAIIQGPLDREQSVLYHSKGNQIFSYSNPQVGQENPEIYRRNYGLALYMAGYDGAMNYAYQKNYKSVWNDFDDPRYREENFTYPTSDGILSTIQWEGFREGVDDVRYISTLLNKIDALKAKGKNVSSLENWARSLETEGDLDVLRGKIIEKILSIK